MLPFQYVSELLSNRQYDQAIDTFMETICAVHVPYEALNNLFREISVNVDKLNVSPRHLNQIIQSMNIMLSALVSPQSRYDKKKICIELKKFFIDPFYNHNPDPNLEILFIRTLVETNFSSNELFQLSHDNYRLDSSNARFIIAWFKLTSYPLPFYLLFQNDNDLQNVDNPALLLRCFQDALKDGRLNFDKFFYTSFIPEYLLDKSEDSLVYSFVSINFQYILNFFDLKLSRRYYHHQYLLYVLGLISTGFPKYIIMWTISDWLIPRTWIPEYKAFRIVESVHKKRQLKFE